MCELLALSSKVYGGANLAYFIPSFLSSRPEILLKVRGQDHAVGCVPHGLVHGLLKYHVHQREE